MGQKKGPVTRRGQNEEEEDEVVFSVCMLVLLNVSLVLEILSLKNALGFPPEVGLLTTFLPEIFSFCDVSEQLFKRTIMQVGYLSFMLGICQLKKE
jgi:hypothetical protein